MTLENVLKQASYNIWDQMRPINGNIFAIREEGLTTIALRTLLEANHHSVKKIIMVGSDVEQSDGYDFQLTLLDNNSSLNFFIQSKRLFGFNVTSTYKSYDKSQSGKLQTFAKTKGIALYAFYNHLLESDLELKTHYYHSITKYDRKSLGITLAFLPLMLPPSFKNIHIDNAHLTCNYPVLYNTARFNKLFDEYKKRGFPFHEISFFKLYQLQAYNNYLTRTGGNIFFPINESITESEIVTTFLQDVELHRKQRISEIQLTQPTFNPRALIIMEPQGDLIQGG